MKRPTIITVLLLVWTIGVVPVGGQEYVPSDPICGTWLNEENTFGAQKLTFKPDGSYEVYVKANDPEPIFTGNCKVTEKWTDSVGCLCYKTLLLKERGQKSFLLIKISDSGRRFESAQKLSDYPLKIDTSANNYIQFYKK